MKLLDRATAFGDKIADFVLEKGTLDLVRLMTILLLLLHGPKSWYARTPLILLGLAGIFMPRVRARRS